MAIRLEYQKTLDETAEPQQRGQIDVCQISLKGNPGEATFTISLVRKGLNGVSDAKQSPHLYIGPGESNSHTDVTTVVSSVRY